MLKEKMPISERAKIFAPFDALKGFREMLKEQEFIKAGMTLEELKDVTEENLEAKKYAQENLGYFISYENLFSTWLKIGNNFTVDNVSIHKEVNLELCLRFFLGLTSFLIYSNGLLAIL